MVLLSLCSRIARCFSPWDGCSTTPPAVQCGKTFVPETHTSVRRNVNILVSASVSGNVNISSSQALQPCCAKLLRIPAALRPTPPPPPPPPRPPPDDGGSPWSFGAGAS